MGIFSAQEGVKDIDQYCKTVGFIFIALGLLHIFLSNLLSSGWGVVLIVLGIISLLYRNRQMILVFGITIIVVGILNLSSIFYYFSVFWLILGALQILLGIQEISRYSKTKSDKSNRKKRRR